MKLRKKVKKVHTMTLVIQTIELDGGFIAVTKIGGMTLRGSAAGRESDAILALFRDMGPGGAGMSATTTDADLAVRLAVSGNSFADPTAEKVKALPDATVE